MSSRDGSSSTGIDHPLFSLVQLGLTPTVIAAFLLFLSAFDPGAPPGAYFSLAAFSFALGALVFAEVRFYRASPRFPIRIALLDITGRWLIASGILGILAYTTQYHAYFSSGVLAAWLALTPVGILGSHMLARVIAQRVITAGRPPRTAVIVGANPLSSTLNTRLQDDPFLNIRVAGFFDDRRGSRLPGGTDVPRLGSLADLPGYVREHPVAVIYLCLPIIWQSRILDLLDDLRDTTASIYYVPDVFMVDLIQARIDRITGIPAIAICETPFYGIRGLTKRTFDLVFSSLGLIILSPVLLFAAVGVKLSSPGPVIYKQTRYGIDGKPILVYKFRSMRVCENDSQVVQATKNDDRVTKFGAFLRRTSLDELPQFVNVLQGRMSIVGPRPHAVVHNEMYRKVIKGYMVRHKVKPGITGWAQVNGLRGETDTVEKMQQRIEFDLEYLRNWSLVLDLEIILKTVRLILADSRAY